MSGSAQCVQREAFSEIKENSSMWNKFYELIDNDEHDSAPMIIKVNLNTIAKFKTHHGSRSSSVSSLSAIEEACEDTEIA